MTWLSEIEEHNREFRAWLESQMDERYHHETYSERMARVLRELAGLLAKTHQNDELDYVYMELSDDAKELCVAANESSRE